MRIRRFEALRYAHISGLSLDFPDDASLHLVLGANEAGKSTFLAALGDALFGFPRQSAADFVHRPDKLRVGLELAAPGLGRLRFRRRKGNANTLEDAQGAWLPDAALAPFLGGLDRPNFEGLFGLNGTRLRAGGQRLLETGGEAEAGLADAANLGPVRQVLDGLREAARKEFGGDGRNRNAQGRVAAEAWGKATQAQREASLLPERWKDAEAAVLRAEARLAEAQRSRGVARQEQARLQRLIQAAPLLSRLDEARQELERLADAASLAEAELARFGECLDLLEEGEAEAKRKHGEAERLETKRAALSRDAEMAAAGPALRLLLEQQTLARQSRERLPAHRSSLAKHAAQLEQAARTLGLDGDTAALVARLPAPHARKALRTALDRHTKLVAAAEERRARRDKDAAELRALEAKLATMPPAAAPAATLTALLEAVQQRGDLAAAADTDARVAARAAAARDTALAGLPRWSGGTAEALASAPLPLPESESLAAERLLAAEAAEQALGKAEAERVEARGAATAKLARLAQASGGAVPTREAVLEARRLRDAALEAWRRALLDRAPWESAASALAARIEAADALADRCAAEAAIVAEHNQARQAEAEAQAASRLAAPALEAAREARRAALAEWAALWPAGVSPGTPKEMAEWQRERDLVLAKAVEATRAEDARDAAAQALRRAREAIAEALGVAPEAASLAALMAGLRAERDRRAEREKLVADIAKARAALDAPEEGAADEAAWQSTWPGLLAAVALPPDLSPAAAAEALDAWDAVAAAAEPWANATREVSECEARVQAFEAAVRALPLNPPPDPWALEALRQRLTRAEAAETQHASWGRDRDEKLAEAEQADSQAEQAREVLRRLVPEAASTEALRAIWRGATARAEAEQRQREAVEALHEHGGEPALRLECADFDRDAARARLDVLAEQAIAAEATLSALGGDLRAARDALERLGAGKGAPGHQREAAEAAARAAEAARRFARLHVAAELLSRGLERFRREKQAPLVQEASRLFRDVTGGHHTRLETRDDEPGKTSLVAVTADGQDCPVAALSEGARDQLFLALRLAAIAQRGQALPFVADDLLANFDDDRARHTLRLLAARGGQTILLTHHRHLLDLADGIAGVSRHELRESIAGAAA